MADRKSSTPSGPGAAFYKRLKALGCVFCGPCYAYMPEIHNHCAPLALDAHTSRYVLVGDFGSVRAVEIIEQEAA